MVKNFVEIMKIYLMIWVWHAEVLHIHEEVIHEFYSTKIYL